MKILSLNVWFGTQKEALRKYLEDHMADTDIFLLQEANKEMEVLRREIFFNWQSITTRKYEVAFDEELCVTSIFKNDIRLLGSGTFFVGNEKQGHGHWLEIEKAGEKYVLCSIHGAAMPGDKLDTEDRIAQTTEILNFLKDRPGKHIIMGDFNLFPDTKSVTLFEEAGYRNLVKEYKIETTRNELAWASWPDSKQLWADYAFVSPEIEVKDFQVPKNEASDHLPLELTIS